MSSDWALVTGANGFLGAELVRQLIAKGEKVKAMVRPESDLRQLQDLPKDQLQMAVADARDCDGVFAALSGCERLYHVASSYSIDERRREQVMADAVEGTSATLEAARRAGVKKIVVTSSVGTLGPSKSDELLTEDSKFAIQDPNCYAAAKVAAERAAIERAESGAPLVLVKPGLIVGPGDWKPTPTGGQIVYYLRHSPGTRMPYPPGGFSYVDVADVAAGHIAAMEKGRVAESYILSGDNLSNRDLYQTLADVTGLAGPGRKLPLGMLRLMAGALEFGGSWSDKAPMITRRVVADYYGKTIFVSSDKAKKELDFTARSAADGLARSCRWFIDHGYVSKKAARRARLELGNS